MRSLLTFTLLSFCSLALVGTTGCTKNSESPTAANSLAVSGDGPKDQSKDQVITGKISVAPLLERATIQPSAAIYLIARPAGQAGGPPTAVKQFTQPFHFPIEFTLSKADAMMPNSPFEGAFDITVRLAQSGSAIPASPGDFEGVVESGAVQAGQKNVEIRLSKIRQ
jgi:hypothetical protein